MNVTEKISSLEKPSVKVKNPRISFSKTSDLTPIASNLFKCPPNKSDVECVNKTSEFKNKVLLEFTKSLERKSELNSYNVDYRSTSNQTSNSPSICPLMKSKVKFVRTKDPPFNILKLGQLIPKHRQLKRAREGRTCVIVSSAGSLTGSGLGSFIGESIHKHNTHETKFVTNKVFSFSTSNSIRLNEAQTIMTLS